MTTEDMLKAVAAAEERGEDWRGLSGLKIGGRNGKWTIHHSTARLLEKGGLAKIEVVTYAASEERVFLTTEGRALLNPKETP